MSTELSLAAWALVLAVIQLLLPAMARNRETGIGYNAGPRDRPGPPMGTMTARLFRAQSNLFETLPLFLAAVVINHLAGVEGSMTLWGCWLYLLARVIYLPLYAFGVPWLRSLVWAVGLFGLVLLILNLLIPG